MKANHELNDLYQNSNSVFYFLRRMKKEGNNEKGGRCLKERKRRLSLIEDRAEFWKEHVKKSMNEQN